MKKAEKRKGFTLIEVLIVIAIIGILSSVVLVGLGQFRGRGRDARRISDLRQVQNALELYFSKFGAYPSASDWAQLSSDLSGAAIGVTRVPNDPSAGKTYHYCATGSSYVVAAELEDPNNPSLQDVQGVSSWPCQPGGNTCGTTPGLYCIAL